MNLFSILTGQIKTRSCDCAVEGKVGHEVLESGEQVGGGRGERRERREEKEETKMEQNHMAKRNYK